VTLSINLYCLKVGLFISLPNLFSLTLSANILKLSAPEYAFISYFYLFT